MQERIFVILFFRSSFVLNLNYQVNIFALCRTRKVASALGRTLTRWLKKKYLKTKEIRS